MKSRFLKLYLTVVLFWLFVTAVDVQSVELLQITNSDGEVTFSWPLVASNFVLQTTTGLDTSNGWTDLVLPTNVIGNRINASLALTNPQQLFRLRVPAASPAIPIFSLAIFYNLDLEINPGAGMAVNGRVHSNQNIWATGNGSGVSSLNFLGLVDAVGTIITTRSPLDPYYSPVTNSHVNFKNFAVQYAAPLSPVPAAVGYSVSSNLLAILNPPPAAYAPPNYVAAYSGQGTNYLENLVDLIISNPASGLAATKGTNLIVYYQNPNNAPGYLTPVLPDVAVSSNVVSSVPPVTNVVYAGYSFVTNVSFFDYREISTVQAVQINVRALNTWLTNRIALGSGNFTVNYIFPVLGVTNQSCTLGGQPYNQLNILGSTAKGHSINSIYVYNGVPPVAYTRLPAVRLMNGQQLPPDGLTVITPQPAYIEGNYNTTTNGQTFSMSLGDTTNTYPAALMADAVTVLSANWLDSYSITTPLPSRNSVSTVINTATLQGIVPSNGANYSGGVENFLRLLENWSGPLTLTYNGSIAVMFPSQYATNFWQNTGVYYNAPNRNWGFDNNFTNAAKLPPLTPEFFSGY